MPGGGAVVIWCDVSPAVREEFDDWHAHEHMPERLAIPGFLRGSRWVADQGEGYFILYELASPAVATGAAYLERLNQPTPWSRKMMPHHRNMVRGLCAVEASFGAALGETLATTRFSGPCKPLDGAMASRKGLVAAHLLRNMAYAPAQTTEQKLRGGDAAPDRVLLVSGYDAQAVRRAAGELALQGAVQQTYRLAYVLSG